METKAQIIDDFENKLPVGKWIKYQESAFRITGYTVTSRGNFAYGVGNGIQLKNYAINFQEIIPYNQVSELEKTDIDKLKWLFDKNLKKAQNEVVFYSEQLKTL